MGPTGPPLEVEPLRNWLGKKNGKPGERASIGAENFR